MTEAPLREAIFDAEDNLHRARDFAQLMVAHVEHIATEKDMRSRALLRLAYEVLDCTDATVEDWRKTLELVVKPAEPEDKPPLKAVGDGGPRP